MSTSQEAGRVQTLGFVFPFFLSLPVNPQQNLVLSIMPTAGTTSGLCLHLHLQLPSFLEIINPQSVPNSLVYHHIPSRATSCEKFSFNHDISVVVNLFFAGCFWALTTPHMGQLSVTYLRGKGGFCLQIS